MGRSPRRSRRDRGDVRLAILLLLDEQPRHGYEIITELTERSEAAGVARFGLPRLETAGQRRTGGSGQAGRQEHFFVDAGRPDAGRAAARTMGRALEPRRAG